MHGFIMMIGTAGAEANLSSLSLCPSLAGHVQPLPTPFPPAAIPEDARLTTFLGSGGIAAPCQKWDTAGNDWTAAGTRFGALCCDVHAMVVCAVLVRACHSAERQDISALIRTGGQATAAMHSRSLPNNGLKTTPG